MNFHISGDYSEEDTPVPIPNTEVKLFSADDTWRETARESRTSPVYRKKCTVIYLTVHFLFLMKQVLITFLFDCIIALVFI